MYKEQIKTELEKEEPDFDLVLNLVRLQRTHIFDAKLLIAEKEICDVYGIDHESLRTKTRKQKSLWARHICYIIRRKNETFHSIGLSYNRDHATVLNAVKSCCSLLESKDREYVFLYRQAMKRINILSQD